MDKIQARSCPIAFSGPELLKRWRTLRNDRTVEGEFRTASVDPAQRERDIDGEIATIERQMEYLRSLGRKPQ